MKYTIGYLKNRSCESVGVDPSEAIEASRDTNKGTATHRLPPVLLRRRSVIRVDPPAAYVEETPINVGRVLAADIGSAGEGQKDQRQNAIKARLGVGSDAEMDRRVYKLVAHILGIS